MFLVVLARLANAGSHVTAFDTEPGPWQGGSVDPSTGVLVVPNSAASLDLGAVTTLDARLRVRLREGARLALALGDATWSAAYGRDGGVRLGAHLLPLPQGHFAWEPDATPVIEPGPEFWDAGDALHAEVVRDATTGMWFLYWTGAHPRTYYGYRQIGLATSTDGINWTRYSGNPVLTVDYDRDSVDGIHVHMPTVVQDGDGWHMYYACYQNGVGNRICHATSTDGFAWTPQGVALDRGAEGTVDAGSLRQPDVRIGPDGVWHMLYNATEPDGHYGPTAYATSTDGWEWTKHGAITDDESRLQGGGMHEGPYGVEQWWNCADQFCHSRASWNDMTRWTDDPDVTLRKGWAWWSDGYIQGPTPWLDGATWHMWFNGYTYSDTFERLGHARSVPVPGAWFDLDVSWDGATLRLAHDGATYETTATGVQGIRITAEGTAELDSAEVRWTEPDPPDTADTDDGTVGDSATSDTGPSEGRSGSSGDATSEDAGCGCANTAPSVPWASLGLLALGRARRRARA